VESGYLDIQVDLDALLLDDEDTAPKISEASWRTFWSACWARDEPPAVPWFRASEVVEQPRADAIAKRMRIFARVCDRDAS
jgi:hypothetical protein